jgi:putative hydrolase of HD superfamily
MNRGRIFLRAKRGRSIEESTRRVSTGESSMIEFFHKIEELKKIKRTGWVIGGVEDSESVADHSFRTALMVMLLAPKELCCEKAVKMALVHDINEVYTKDIPTTSMGRRKKFVKEKKAMTKLLRNLPEKKELMNIWLEFEERKSPEAVFVHQVDKLETMLQAVEYKKKNLNDIWKTSIKEITDKSLLRIAEKLSTEKERS